MAQLYALPRDGGPASPRFKAYVSRTPSEPGLIAYNPMAGPAALETVEMLIACDAEALAQQIAQQVVDLCEYQNDVALSVAVRSSGLWTHRVATEVEERAGAKPRTQGRGFVSIWSREPCDVNDVAREAAAECVRVMWTTQHGKELTARSLLAREGLAYAIASRYATPGPYAAPLTDEESLAIIGILDILGDSGDSSDMANVLFGDAAAIELGWTPLGIPLNAGYKWAVARALEHLQAASPLLALRSTINP
jgi:hypothetical protein